MWGLWQKWIDDDSFWPEHVSLINGDIYHPHIFVDADYKVVALDDWSNAEVTDPAADFTLYFAAAGREALEDLIRRYEFAGGMTWPRMADQAEMYVLGQPREVRRLRHAHGRPLAPDERQEHGAPLCEHARGQRVRVGPQKPSPGRWRGRSSGNGCSYSTQSGHPADNLPYYAGASGRLTSRFQCG